MPIIYVPGNYDSRISKTTNEASRSVRCERHSVCLSVCLSLIVTRWKWWKIIDINWQRQIFFFAVEWSCYRVRRIETECLRKSNFHSDFNGAALLSIGICFDFTRNRRQMLGGCCSSWPNTKVLWCC